MTSRIKRRLKGRTHKGQQQQEEDDASAPAAQNISSGNDNKDEDGSGGVEVTADGVNSGEGRDGGGAIDNAIYDAALSTESILQVSPVGIRSTDQSGGTNSGTAVDNGSTGGADGDYEQQQQSAQDALHILPSFSGDDADGGRIGGGVAPDHLVGMADDDGSLDGIGGVGATDSTARPAPSGGNTREEDAVERAIREARASVTAVDDEAVKRAIQEARGGLRLHQVNSVSAAPAATAAGTTIESAHLYISDDSDDDDDDDDKQEDDIPGVYGEGVRAAAADTTASGAAVIDDNDNDDYGSEPSSDPDEGDALEQIIAGSGSSETDGSNDDFISMASNAVLAEVMAGEDQGTSTGGGPSSAPSPPAPPPLTPGGTPRKMQHLQRLRARQTSAPGGNDAGSLTTTSAAVETPRAVTSASAAAAAVRASSSPPTPSRPAGGGRAAPPTKKSAAVDEDFDPDDVQAGVLPDVLMTMRQKIESLTLFDSDMIRLAQMGTGGGGSAVGGGSDPMSGYYDEEDARESKEQLRRSFQQSISAAVLVSLAHKRYERRRLAAMEIEKVVRSLVQQGELDRVRAILLLLSDDYVRSTSEDARKGGVVALAASAIGLKKADETSPELGECRDLILASVVHACQDHSQRVRYYATESLFNVVKVLPSLAVQHFFILFEILRSLYADVDLDVRSGAELLDKKLKEVIVGAINAGQFTADACVPLFARFVYMKNKPTKRLTLTWLQEFVEKLVGAPILEFLHLFLGGVFAMVSDPNQSIRDLALTFLQSVLPKLLENNEDFEDGSTTMVDFDKILQSLVTSMENPDPFVRKVAMFWMTRIVYFHIGDPTHGDDEVIAEKNGVEADSTIRPAAAQSLTAASISVRNSLPHVLPGILLSIGDTFHGRRSTSSKGSVLPDQSTHALAEQTNAALQDAVRRDGASYVSHLDGFIVALHEELDTGVAGRNPPAVDRRPYRLDVKSDGSGIESTGWFRASSGTYEDRDDATMSMSRLCALDWIIVLYDYVVPDSLKAEYACEFIPPIIHQLVYEPPEMIVLKSFEVLAKITVPVKGEREAGSPPGKVGAEITGEANVISPDFDPMSDSSAAFALDILDSSQSNFKSRNRQVFSCLLHLHSQNHHLLSKLSTVIEFMCTLQPPEFVFVSFALELDRYVVQRVERRNGTIASAGSNERKIRRENAAFARDLEFVSSFVQQMNNVLLNSAETSQLRDLLKSSIGLNEKGNRSERKARLFHILIHAFAHNLVATLSLCLWGGAYLTASTFLHQIDPLDVNLIFYLEVDEFVELLERPLFRNFHLLMLECDKNPKEEGSGAMLFQTLKSLLMLIPQSTSYNVLKDRLLTVSRFRQSAVNLTQTPTSASIEGTRTEIFVKQILQTRTLHCDARWRMIRAESLEAAEMDVNAVPTQEHIDDEAHKRRKLLGYADEKDEADAKKRIKEQMHTRAHRLGEEGKYDEFDALEKDDAGGALKVAGFDEKNSAQGPTNGTSIDEAGEDADMDDVKFDEEGGNKKWKEYWAHTGENGVNRDQQE